MTGLLRILGEDGKTAPSSGKLPHFLFICRLSSFWDGILSLCIQQYLADFSFWIYLILFNLLTFTAIFLAASSVDKWHTNKLNIFVQLQLFPFFSCSCRQTFVLWEILRKNSLFTFTMPCIILYALIIHFLGRFLSSPQETIVTFFIYHLWSY